MPNNRQWVALLLTLTAVGWLFASQERRESVGGLWETVRRPKLLIPVLGLLAWIALEVAVGARLSLWDARLVTDTIFWVLLTGVALFGAFTKAMDEPRFFRRTILRTLGPVLVAEALLDYFVFPLLVEFIIVPAITLLVIFDAVAGSDPGLRPAKRALDAVLGTVGLGLLLQAVLKLVQTWDGIDKTALAREAALPFWLTLGLLPYVYSVAVWAAYERAFIRLDWRAQSSVLTRLRIKFALVASFHLKAYELSLFNGPWICRLAEASTFRATRQLIRDFRAAERKQARESQATRARLVE